MFFYAIKSLQRQTTRYIRIVCILTCAMIIPLVLSILGSSIVYGQREQTRAETKGADYRIDNPPYEVVEIFSQMKEFEVFLEEDSLYLVIQDERVRSKNDSINTDVLAYSLLIKEALETFDMQHLTVTNMTGMYQMDHTTNDFMRQVNFISVIIILVSVLVFQAGYRAHIGNFSQEIESLYAIGFSHRNIAMFFFWTLTAEFILSCMFSIVISYAVMRILFMAYLEVQSGGYSWMIFDVDWYSVLFLACTWYAVLLIVFSIQMRQHKKQLTSGKRHITCRKTIVKIVGTETVLENVLWTRNGKLVKYSIVLSMLVVFLSVFLLNYASINAEAIKEEATADFSISTTLNINGAQVGIDDDILNELKGIDGIRVHYGRSLPTTTYLAAQQHVGSRYAVYESGEYEYVQTHILLYPNATEAESTVNMDCVPVWLNEFQPDANWKIGDYIDVYYHNPAAVMNQGRIKVSDAGIPFLTERIRLQVMGFVSESYMDAPLMLYLGTEDYEKMVGSVPVTSLQIEVEETINREKIKEALEDIFDRNSHCEFIDLVEAQEISARGSIGIYLLIFVVTVLFLMLISLVVGILLTEFVIQQREQNELFYLLGLSMNNLQNVYRKISIKAFSITMAVGISVGCVCTILFFGNTGYRIALNARNIAIYIIMIISVWCAMYLPIQVEVYKQFPKTTRR